MKRRRNSINENAKVAADLLVDLAAKKVADNVINSDTEEEETPGTTTPTGNNGTAPSPIVSTTNQMEKDDEPDPMMEYILKAVEEQKNKQAEANQLGLAAQQQNQELQNKAADIMKEIEDYIKNNKKQ